MARAAILKLVVLLNRVEKLMMDLNKVRMEDESQRVNLHWVMRFVEQEF